MLSYHQILTGMFQHQYLNSLISFLQSVIFHFGYGHYRWLITPDHAWYRYWYIFSHCLCIGLYVQYVGSRELLMCLQDHSGFFWYQIQLFLAHGWFHLFLTWRAAVISKSMLECEIFYLGQRHLCGNGHTLLRQQPSLLIRQHNLLKLELNKNQPLSNVL